MTCITTASACSCWSIWSRWPAAGAQLELGDLRQVLDHPGDPQQHVPQRCQVRWPCAAAPRGIRAFTAETLSENAAMLRVFADAGLRAQRSLVDGVYDITFPLPADEADTALGTYRDTVAARERSADVASMRPVLTPRGPGR